MPTSGVSDQEHLNEWSSAFAVASLKLPSYVHILCLPDRHSETVYTSAFINMEIKAQGVASGLVCIGRVYLGWTSLSK